AVTNGKVTPAAAGSVENSRDGLEVTEPSIPSDPGPTSAPVVADSVNAETDREDSEHAPTLKDEIAAPTAAGKPGRPAEKTSRSEGSKAEPPPTPETVRATVLGHRDALGQALKGRHRRDCAREMLAKALDAVDDDGECEV